MNYKTTKVSELQEELKRVKFDADRIRQDIGNEFDKRRQSQSRTLSSEERSASYKSSRSLRNKLRKNHREQEHIQDVINRKSNSNKSSKFITIVHELGHAVAHRATHAGWARSSIYIRRTARPGARRNGGGHFLPSFASAEAKAVFSAAGGLASLYILGEGKASIGSNGDVGLFTRELRHFVPRVGMEKYPDFIIELTEDLRLMPLAIERDEELKIKAYQAVYEAWVIITRHASEIYELADKYFYARCVKVSEERLAKDLSFVKPYESERIKMPTRSWVFYDQETNVLEMVAKKQCGGYTWKRAAMRYTNRFGNATSVAANDISVRYHIPVRGFTDKLLTMIRNVMADIDNAQIYQVCLDRRR